jgi:hypothetical protein
LVKPFGVEILGRTDQVRIRTVQRLVLSRTVICGRGFTVFEQPHIIFSTLTRSVLIGGSPGNLMTLSSKNSSAVVNAAGSALLELQMAVFEGLERKPGHSFEIGGLLLGDGGPDLRIDAVQPLPIEYRFGPSFWLSSADIAKWKEAIAQYSGARPSKVIGHFRSQQIDRAPLDEVNSQDVDHAIADLLHLDNPIMLLVPVDGKAVREALVFRRMNGIWSQTLPCSLEVIPTAPVPVPRLPSAPPPIAAAPPRPAPAQPHRKIYPRLGLAAAALLLASAIVWRFLLPVGATSQIGLAAHSTIGGISVVWNRQSALFRQSTSGILIIRDGDSRQQIQLTRNQLLGGNAVYVPRTGQVDFRLEVYRDRDHYSGESLTVMTGLSPAPPQPAPQPATATAPAPAPAIVSKTVDTSDAARIVPPPVSFAPRPPPRTRVPASVPKAQSQPGELILGPPPELSVPRAAANAPTLDPALFSLLPPPSRPSPPPSGSPAPSAPATYKAPVPLRKPSPAIPESMRIMLGHLMPQEKLSLDIKIQIDASGNVTAAAPQGNVTVAQKLLTTYALQAARLWHFEPARRNDQPVNSEYVITFVFRHP